MKTITHSVQRPVRRYTPHPTLPEVCFGCFAFEAGAVDLAVERGRGMASWERRAKTFLVYQIYSHTLTPGLTSVAAMVSTPKFTLPPRTLH